MQDASKLSRGTPFAALPAIILETIVVALLLAACGGKSSEPRVATTTYDIKTLYRQSEQCVSADSDCAHVILEYPVFSSAPGVGVEEMLNDSVTAMILSCALDSDAADSIPDVVSQFFDGYADAKQQFEDYRIAWTLQVSIDVNGDTAGVICLALSHYEYTGGAHPISELSYHDLDTETGKTVTLDQVLVPGMEDSLKILAEAEFRRVNHLSPEQVLGDAGYWFKDNAFTLTDNACIGGEGITFFYNPYEVAPYSMGSTEVFLQYSDLKGVIDLDRRIKGNGQLH